MSQTLTTTSTVEPYEAQGLTIPDTDEARAAAHDLCTAVNGFYYPGDRSAAILEAVAWLATQPAHCAALGLRPLDTPAAQNEGS